MSKETARHCLNRAISRASLAFLTAASVGLAAYKFYEDKVEAPLNAEKCQLEKSLFFSPEIIDQIIKDLEELKGFDVAIFFNTGGWGSTSLEEAPGWEQILQGIQQNLTAKGYQPKIIECWRQEKLGEIIDQTQPSPAAQKLAWRISLLTVYKPDLRVIVAGLSTGASLAEETMCCLDSLPGAKGNDRILAIEAGRLLGGRKPLVSPHRTLSIANENDALVNGDLFHLIKRNLPPRVYWGENGDVGLGKLRIDFTAPFHLYDWESISQEVGDFLDQKFPRRE